MSNEVNLAETMIGTPIIYRLMSNHPILRKYCPKFNERTMFKMRIDPSNTHIGAAHINFSPDMTDDVDRVHTLPFSFPEFFRKIGIAYNIPADKVALLTSEYVIKTDLVFSIQKISNMDDWINDNFPISEEEFDNYKRAARAFWKRHHKLPLVVTVVDFKEYCKTNCCNYCGKPATLTCQKCLKVKYCSRDCQRLDWPTHKGVCKAPAPASVSAPAPAPAPAASAPARSLPPKKVNNSDPVLPRAPARAVASVPARPSAPLLMIENAPRLLMIKNAPAPVSASVSAPVANTVRTANLPVVYSPPFRPAPGTARPRPPPPSGYKGKGGKKTRRRRNIKRRTSVSKR